MHVLTFRQRVTHELEFPAIHAIVAIIVLCFLVCVALLSKLREIGPGKILIVWLVCTVLSLYAAYTLICLARRLTCEIIVEWTRPFPAANLTFWEKAAEELELIFLHIILTLFVLVCFILVGPVLSVLNWALPGQHYYVDLIEDLDRLLVMAVFCIFAVYLITCLVIRLTKAVVLEWRTS